MSAARWILLPHYHKRGNATATESMYADTLLLLERLTLLRLVAWAASSVLVGTGVLAFAASRRVRAPLLKYFAVQMTAWGVVELIIGAVGWRTLGLRDAASAARLNNMLWLNAGLSVGLVATGLVLATCGWILGKRLSVVGAGVATAVHGLVLLLVDLGYLDSILRLTLTPV